MISSHPFDLLLEIDGRNSERAALLATEAKQPPGVEGCLALRLGSWNLLLSMQDVAEIIPVPRITQVPGVKSWLMGMANSHGTIISVVDLKEFLSGKPTVCTANSRLIVARSGEWSYGLLVDEIIGMRQFNPQKRAAPLDTLDACLRPYVIEVLENDDRKWLILNINNLLNAYEFLDAAL